MNSPVIYPVIVPTSSQLRSYNFYLVHDEENLYLVDAGVNTDTCWQLFISVLDQNNFSLKDITAIILTHHHNDHVGLVNRMIAERDIPVYAHPEAWPRLKRDKYFLQERIFFFKWLYSVMGCRELGNERVKEMSKLIEENAANIVHGPIRPLKQGDSIGSFEIIEVPGHAIDHIALYNEDSGALLAGDHLIAHISSNALVEPDNMGNIFRSLYAYEHSLKKCEALHITTIYPGHGELITVPKRLINRRLKGIDRKALRIIDLLGDKQLTPAEIAQAYYGSRYKKLFTLVMSEIIGQLVRMEGIKKVAYKKKDNKRYYYRV